MQIKRLIALFVIVALVWPRLPSAQLSGAPDTVQAGVQVSTGTPACTVVSATGRDVGQYDPCYSDSLSDVFGVYRGNAGNIERPGTSRFTGASHGPDGHSLPSLGDGSGGSLSPQAERKLGERVMRAVRHDPDYLGDWLVRDYLNSVASRLAVAARERYIGGYVPDFDLFSVRDMQINAFSMPGGFIGMNTGLIVATRTESELASVVGHEMGHVLQRHIARMITVSERNSYAAIAGMLFGLLAGALAHSADLGSAVAIGGQAFAIDNQLRFSRTAEREADRVGFMMLEGAGFDPYGMSSFFERMERGTVANVGVPPYARTHPLTGERIADMADRARNAAYRQPRQSPEYVFVQARVRVLQNKSASDLADIEQRLRAEIDDQTAPSVAANWYGIALAQMLQAHYAAAQASLWCARAAFGALQSAQPDGMSSTVSLDVLGSEITRRVGRPDDALRDAQLARRRDPASHAAIDAYLQAMIVARRYADAQALARAQAAAEPQRSEWWRYLAQASAALGDTVQQRRAQAEMLALDGAWPSAIRQLRQARDTQGASYYDMSAIAARLREFEERYREERDDDKHRG
ncbi:M48 family metallopeptidase [Mycetohabitans endofungorum]|uniref:M48 family metalloprotease n=1 Tax=Mycetohabitans endofungorum TaxID=417203 RepID=UPI0030D51B3A